MAKDFEAPSRSEILITSDWPRRLEHFADASFQLAYVYAPKLGQPNHAPTAQSPRQQEPRLGGPNFAAIIKDLLATNPQLEADWTQLHALTDLVWAKLSEDGSFYLHLDHADAHYVKVLLDELLGRDKFLNEIIWVRDFGKPAQDTWPTRHDTILVYVKNPRHYYYSIEQIDREPYMAPSLVSAEKARRGKLPTDVWWHTLLRTQKEDPNQPQRLLQRIMAASSQPGSWVLGINAPENAFTGAAKCLERHYVLIPNQAYSLR